MTETLAIPEDRELTPEGWITRAGKFLSCDREWMHGTVAMLALDGRTDQDSETRAEKLRWIRLSDYGNRMLGKPNQAQLNKLADYADRFDLDYKSLIASITSL